jgi:hypothetical protein
MLPSVPSRFRLYPATTILPPGRRRYARWRMSSIPATPVISVMTRPSPSKEVSRLPSG